MFQVFHLSRQSWLATAWQTPAIQRQPHNWIFQRFFDVILIHNRNFTNTWKFLHNILLFVCVCVWPLLVHDKGLHNFTLIWSWCYSYLCMKRFYKNHLKMIMVRLVSKNARLCLSSRKLRSIVFGHKWFSNSSEAFESVATDVFAIL